ncbi:hypothetical protein ACQUFY_06420 [Robbsia andropogonis]|uniref:hypothetical protein n=1 Tax=Robbsia andropogonis TaxID=28092 RepID=UPI003D1C5EC2
MVHITFPMPSRRTVVLVIGTLLATTQACARTLARSAGWQIEDTVWLLEGVVISEALVILFLFTAYLDARKGR